MRRKTKFKRICVTEATYERLKEDQKHFQETIGDGKWSISDTIIERTKILDSLGFDSKPVLLDKNGNKL